MCSETFSKCRLSCGAIVTRLEVEQAFWYVFFLRVFIEFPREDIEDVEHRIVAVVELARKIQGAVHSQPTSIPQNGRSPKLKRSQSALNVSVEAVAVHARNGTSIPV